MELLQTILGSSAVVTLLGVAIGGAIKLWQRRNSNNRLADRDHANWNADYRQAAEDHLLNYDVPMRDRVMQHEGLINQMRRELGLPEVAFPPIPRPVSLFPRRHDDGHEELPAEPQS